jgi:hypothetical protein
MKTLFTLVINITLFSYFLSFSAFAIHDIAAINVTPTNHQVQFCFDLDTRKLHLDKLYIAAITEEGLCIVNLLLTNSNKTLQKSVSFLEKNLKIFS